jgi:hypothetical protein
VAPFRDFDAIETDRLQGLAKRRGAGVAHREPVQGDAAVRHAGCRVRVAPGDQRRQAAIEEPLAVVAHRHLPLQQPARRHPRDGQYLPAIDAQAGESNHGRCDVGHLGDPVHEPGPLLAQGGPQRSVVQVEPAAAPRRSDRHGGVGRDDLEVSLRVVHRRNAKQPVVGAHQRMLAAGTRRHAQRRLAPGDALLERVGSDDQVVDAGRQRHSCTWPSMQVTLAPPIQIVPSASRSTAIRPARPRAVPCEAT